MQKIIGIIDMGSSWIPHIERHIQDQGFTPQVIKYTKEMYLESNKLHNISGIIISGSSLFPTTQMIKELLPQFEFIKSSNIPVLGICLGHQIISLLYGGEIVKKEMIDNQETIHQLQKSVLLDDVLQDSLFQEEHAKHASIPKDFIHLCTSQSCNNEAMQHKEHSIFGTQFHPEVSDSGNIIFRNFLSLCEI